ncbi:alpha/beta hydrolase [Cupriavidus numazuensis]|uniref:alpha/beta hydrolase n=1 Tax=Cupriavidus numazuensis TaxID=221992 RepID=UPI0036192E85
MLNDLEVALESEGEQTNAVLDNLIRNFSTPQRIALTQEEENCLLHGERFAHYHDGFRLACWHFGFGPEVVLAHGWNGRGANLWRFVNPLVSAGFSVTVFDGPAHGESKGSRTSPVHFADALRTLCGYLGPVHTI